MDLFSRGSVGWSMPQPMTRSLVFAALEMARKARRPLPGVLDHSDRGCQYASLDHRYSKLAAGAV